MFASRGTSGTGMLPGSIRFTVSQYDVNHNNRRNNGNGGGGFVSTGGHAPSGDRDGWEAFPIKAQLELETAYRSDGKIVGPVLMQNS